LLTSSRSAAIQTNQH